MMNIMMPAFALFTVLVAPTFVKEDGPGDDSANRLPRSSTLA